MLDRLKEMESKTSEINPPDEIKKSKILSYLANRKGLIAAVLLSAGIMLGCDKAACNCAGCEVVSCGRDNDGDVSMNGCSGCGN